MPTTVKTQILAAVDTLLAALVGTGTGQFRAIDRVQDIEQMSDKLPSLHWTEGDEVPAPTEEDSRGYTLEFDLILKMTISDYRDPKATLDTLTGYLQTAMEADLTLGSLVTWIRYRGDFNWVHQQHAPKGGRFLFYRVQYRRLRGNPNTGY